MSGPSQAAPSQAAPALDLEGLGKPKGVPVPVMIGATLSALIVGGVLGGVVLSGGEQAKAAPPASASTPAPPPASSAPPAPAPKSLVELAIEGDKSAFDKLEAKPLHERTGAETIALIRGDLALKRKQLEELARKTELVEAFGRSEDTQGKFMAAVKDPPQATTTLEILAGLPGPIGPDYLYKVYKMRGRYEETRQLALDLLHSKDVYEKASDALKVVLDMYQELRKDEKDCAKMLKLLVRAQADADTRAFSPIAALNSKRGCGDNKLEDCWACLRSGEGKEALAEAVKLARKNKAPF